MAESTQAGTEGRTGIVETVSGFLTNPATMIAMALLAVALFATPYYLRTTEQQLFEGELLLSFCGGLTSALPVEHRRQARAPLL